MSDATPQPLAPPEATLTLTVPEPPAVVAATAAPKMAPAVEAAASAVDGAPFTNTAQPLAHVGVSRFLL